MNIDIDRPSIIQSYNEHIHDAKHDDVERESYDLPFRIHVPVVPGSIAAVTGFPKPGDKIVEYNGVTYIEAQFKEVNSLDSSEKSMD